MFAPLGIIVKELPEQIEPEFTVIVGVVFTTIVLMAVLELTHPNELVPVTFMLELLDGVITLLPLE